jgi:hypothetical protein
MWAFSEWPIRPERHRGMVNTSPSERSRPRGGRYTWVKVEGFPSVGNEPQWRADGKELYYLSGNKLMAVPVKTDSTNWEVGVPRVLFEARFVSSTGRRNRYVAAADGRFLVNTLPEHAQTEGSSLSVLVNWLNATGK